jgi:hypothetical protein
VRIYRQHELELKIERAGFFLRGSHHAHAFHSPYWWLKCAYGLDNTDAAPVKRYHDFLCHLIEHNPRGRRHRARAQPRARQERRALRREGARRAWEAQPWLSTAPEVAGIVTRDEIAQTVDAIASVQQPDGNIPWVPGGQTDPWNLVEAAIALDVGGRFAEAERAYGWLCRMQHFTGSWHAYYQGDAVKEHTLDTNVTCYIANGVWHHYLATGDTGFLSELFPVVERAIDFALDHQHPTGEIEWDADPLRIDGKGALLTGSSSIYSSLRCAIAAAERLGRERPDWELSLGSLAIAIAHRPERFLDKERWAMDWYYPILAGVLAGTAGEAAHRVQVGTIVVPGRVRAVRAISRGSPPPRRASW